MFRMSRSSSDSNWSNGLKSLSRNVKVNKRTGKQQTKVECQATGNERPSTSQSHARLTRLKHAVSFRSPGVASSSQAPTQCSTRTSNNINEQPRQKRAEAPSPRTAHLRNRAESRASQARSRQRPRPLQMGSRNARRRGYSVRGYVSYSLILLPSQQLMYQAASGTFSSPSHQHTLSRRPPLSSTRPSVIQMYISAPVRYVLTCSRRAGLRRIRFRVL